MSSDDSRTHPKQVRSRGRVFRQVFAAVTGMLNTCLRSEALICGLSCLLSLVVTQVTEFDKLMSRVTLHIFRKVKIRLPTEFGCISSL